MEKFDIGPTPVKCANYKKEVMIKLSDLEKGKSLYDLIVTQNIRLMMIIINRFRDQFEICKNPLPISKRKSISPLNNTWFFLSSSA